MSEEKDKLREHEIDGIQEYDNPLPQWWVGLFYLCVIYSVGYLAYIHFMDGASLEEELVNDLNDRQQLLATSHSGADESNADETQNSTFLERVQQPENIAAGKEVYLVNCIACHAPDGGGGIGPNLTDKHWIHGGGPDAILATINDGVPAKGMPGWKAILGPKKSEQLTAFVISLQGTTPANGKDPQGTLNE